MNKDHLQQIFSHYLNKFEYITAENEENDKWFVAKRFRTLMDEALNQDEESFPAALYKAKKATENMIDSYTQPFYGLVQFAEHEPQTVKQMFVDLYSEDGGDIHRQAKLISDFLDKSNELLDKYSPGSYRYKQDAHSVSAYLFLYDPDHHYMYKASQSGIFADCIEFYDDWGSGDHINLEIYGRMCDWLVEQIWLCPELLATDKSRFELSNSDEMFADTNKHMLAFDIIYACSVYDLYDGILFTRPNPQEKNLIIEQRKTALRLLKNYNSALDELEQLNQALQTVENRLVAGTAIKHKAFGKGKILSCSSGLMNVSFAGQYGVKELDIATVFSMGIAQAEDAALAEVILAQAPQLKNKAHIQKRYQKAERELEPYKEYLE